MNSYEQIPFDWSLVDKLNPEVIVGQSEMKLVRSFVKMILNTDFQGLPQASFINRDFSKLLILFQATIKLLYTSQKQLQNVCNERTKKYKEAAEEIAKLKQTESNLRKLLHSEQCQGETCPLCKKRFRNMEYIDKHIKNRHIERLAAWEYVRGFTDSLAPDSKNINNSSSNDQNNDNKVQQESKKPKLKFMNCSSITIESSMPLKAKKETRYFELDEEEVQPNNNDNFGYNNYINNQVPPIQADLAKTPHAQNAFNNNQHQILPDDSLIDNDNNNINQIGISNNDQIAKSQMDMITNRATSNIINGYKEIAESHKTHYSTPQTPKENPSKRDKNAYMQLPPNSPLATPNYPKSKTPDQGKHPKIVTNQPEEEEQTPVQRKHHHHRQQQQQYEAQQQQLQIQQESKKENRPQTPPAISCRKSQNDNEQEDRPSTTGSAIQEGQKHQRRQQKYQQQQQQLQMQQQQQLQQQIQQQQIQMQQMQQQQQLQQQLQIQQQQQLQQQLQMQQIQQKQQQAQIQQKQPPPEESKLENEENDPFLLDNDDENAEIEKTENTNHIEFTTAQLDDLIQRSDNEEGNDEVEVRTQTPKKRRKKRRTVIPMPDGVIPQNDSTSPSTTTPVSTNNPQEVKFNFKGTKGVIQQHELQETDMINENQKIKVAKKPSVTFINADDNFDDGASIRPAPQQQQRKDHVEIGIVKRIDAEPFIENIKPAPETRNSSRNETKNVKRMGGYDITNSELENLIKESSSQYNEYNE